MKTKGQQLTEERETLLAGAKSITSAKMAAGENLTASESRDVKDALQRVDEIDAEIKKFKDGADLMSRLGAIKHGDLGDNGGHLFSESDAQGFVTAAKSKGSFSTTVSYKAPMVVGSLLPPVGETVIAAQEPKATFALRDLFQAASASGATVRYYTLGNPDATDVAIVAEGGLKPESETAYAAVDAALVKLATRWTITDELGEDAPFLVSEIQKSVLRNVLVRENKLVIDTIAATSGILTGTSTAATLLDLLATEIGESEAINGVTPTALLLNPSNLSAVRVAKASTAGSYFIDPLSSGPTSIHGVPLISSPAVAAGTAYLLTSGFGTFYSRGALRIEAGFTGDDWIYNRMTIRAEERVLPVVNRPSLVTKLTLT